MNELQQLRECLDLLTERVFSIENMLFGMNEQMAWLESNMRMNQENMKENEDGKSLMSTVENLKEHLSENTKYIHGLDAQLILLQKRIQKIDKDRHEDVIGILKAINRKMPMQDKRNSRLQFGLLVNNEKNMDS